MFSDDKNLQQLLEQVRNNSAEAEKFAANPEGYLQSRGVNTENLRFADASGELSDADLENAAGGQALDADGPTVCTSVGAGAGIVTCTSVGDAT